MLYFDRGVKSLPPFNTSDPVRIKTKSGWKPEKVIKLAHNPGSVIVASDQQWNSLQTRQERIIKTQEINKGTITSLKGDRENLQERRE